MKKFITVLLIATIASLTIISPLSVSAASSNTNGNITYSENENVAYGINNTSGTSIINNNTTESVSATSSSLINETNLTLTKDGNNLTIYGYTCSTKVCSTIGFTYLKIQRYANGTWNDVYGWNGMYAYDTSGHAVSFTDSVSSGYSYRAVCEHYAFYDGILFFDESQSIYNETSALYVY